MILFWMIVLHYIADFPLQGQFLAEMKGKYDYLLFCHAMIWGGVISAGLLQLGFFAPWKAVMLVVGHFIIDRWKARKADKTYALTKDLWVDQFLHTVQIFIALLI